MSTHDPAVIVAANRTPVCPHNGALKHYNVAQLVQVLIPHLLPNVIDPADIQRVILGNALYGGGNPARFAALSAGLHCHATTIDTQCASGLSAVIDAVAKLQSHQADWIVAGGVESSSQRPLRAHNTHPPQFYERPRFVPGDDPDMAIAAARLSEQAKIDQQQQWQYAITSHQKASASDPKKLGLIGIGDLHRDSATRLLHQKLCQRAPILAGKAPYCIDTSTTALAADAAALVLLTRRSIAQKHQLRYCEVEACVERSAAPNNPAAAINQAVKALQYKTHDFARIELMEAFAVQALYNQQSLRLNPDCINSQGGALARGHPIGASGAVLLCNLFHQLDRKQRGLATIASAGGLAAALVMQCG